MELDGTDIDTNRMPDVSRMKVKKIQVKNPDRLRNKLWKLTIPAAEMRSVSATGLEWMAKTK